MAVRVELKLGQGLWVAGPARVKVVEGELLASGYTVGRGDEVLVRGTRGFTFYVGSERGVVELSLGSGASYRLVSEGYETVRSWDELAGRLEAENARRIVVVGPVESGKSTLVAWLRNRLQLCAVESDIGQNELGTPAFVSVAEFRGRTLTLQDAGYDRAYMVGHVSADRVAELVVAAALRAARSCVGGYVVDTDGYVAGRGVFYKAALCEVLQPDYVVATEPTLARQLEHLGFNVLPAAKPRLARERGRLDRRVFRQRLYTALFSSSTTMVLRSVRVVGICPYTVSNDAIAYDCNGVKVVESSRRPSEGLWVRPGWAKGLLASLRVKGHDIPVLVDQIDLRNERIVVRVPNRHVEEAGKAGVLVLGWVKLSENFSENLLQPGLHPLVHLRRGR